MASNSPKPSLNTPRSTNAQRLRKSSNRGDLRISEKGDKIGDRRSVLLEDAARLFGKSGFDKTSMRDIATAFGVLPGSLYHHFGSKDELFIAVYAAGVDQMIASITRATESLSDPWDRLEAACVAHLQELLAEENVMAAVLANWSTANAKLRKALVRERDRYERVLVRLVDAVELLPGTERRYFRLALLGAINWALTWYQPGREPPANIARKLMAIFRPIACTSPSGVRARKNGSITVASSSHASRR